MIYASNRELLFISCQFIFVIFLKWDFISLCKLGKSLRTVKRSYCNALIFRDAGKQSHSLEAECTLLRCIHGLSMRISPWKNIYVENRHMDNVLRSFLYRFLVCWLHGILLVLKFSNLMHLIFRYFNTMHTNNFETIERKLEHSFFMKIHWTY